MRENHFSTDLFRFLKELKNNNKREWFAENKQRYEASVRDPFLRFIADFAPMLHGISPRFVADPKPNGGSLFRIYRDTRFSKDKAPYKTHVAASFPRAGLGKHEGAGFYFHISPDEVLIGGGLYMPLPEDLQAVRNYIAERFET